MGRRTEALLGTLANASAKDAAMFQQLQAGLDQLRQGLHVTSVDQRVLGDFQRLLGLHEDVRALSFRDMRQRYDARGPTLKNLTKKRDICLRSQDGVLHVAGKLGSGKSTIMKFLAQCPETNDRLKMWAGDRKLASAAFFFWKPGSELQRSCLDSCCRATQRNTALHDSRCFCFLIDGLDEYEETAQHDRRHMVDLLKNWRKASLGAVKLCVYSREDNVFMNAFPADTRLCLHQLKRFDMKKYVLLVREILEKSHGIFLWVALVVKLVCEQIESGATAGTLSKFINTLSVTEQVE
ncbi:hypothetical protein B0T26DRAFT_814697 [Lasiosphaeria miniovina]|uniref:NACHT domain-containing protein n=1 Tax=Lasiosphaeria miniovina TaxID=1954250 RepID=A0AA39ZYQ9_9PEZI|nr:uncharacterized protein B0T26DRAFT_814697 [Lasiosphaeria miniovina]KAK0706079.1 hypothetical protein B0T26DRAFT_814697 [Lasiosphaeria miniovina]